MPIKSFIAFLFWCIANISIAGTIFRCTDPVSAVVTFSDLPCQNVEATPVRIIHFNDVSGITRHERRLIDSFEARLRAKDDANQNQQKRGEIEKAELKKRCHANQKQIDKVYLKLKHGYKGKKYNTYHGKLRDLKRFRHRNCD